MKEDTLSRHLFTPPQQIIASSAADPCMHRLFFVGGGDAERGGDLTGRIQCVSALHTRGTLRWCYYCILQDGRNRGCTTGANTTATAEHRQQSPSATLSSLRTALCTSSEARLARLELGANKHSGGWLLLRSAQAHIYPVGDLYRASDNQLEWPARGLSSWAAAKPSTA